MLRAQSHNVIRRAFVLSSVLPSLNFFQLFFFRVVLCSAYALHLMPIRMTDSRFFFFLFFLQVLRACAVGAALSETLTSEDWRIEEKKGKLSANSDISIDGTSSSVYGGSAVRWDRKLRYLLWCDAHANMKCARTHRLAFAESCGGSMWMPSGNAFLAAIPILSIYDSVSGARWIDKNVPDSFSVCILMSTTFSSSSSSSPTCTIWATSVSTVDVPSDFIRTERRWSTIVGDNFIIW